MKTLLLVAGIVAAVILLSSGVLPYRLVRAQGAPDPTASEQSKSPTTTTPNRADSSRAEAIRLYPSLAQKDSPMNKAFVALYEAVKHDDPDFLSTPDWPMALAARAASSSRQAPRVTQPTAPSPPPEPTTPPVRLVGRVIQRLPSGGLVIECRRARVIASGMASIGGGGGAYSADGGDVHGTFVLRGHPKEQSFADDDSIETHAREDGIFQGDTVLGATRTLRVYRYTPEPTEASSAKTGRSKLKGTVLDQRPQ